MADDRDDANEDIHPGGDEYCNGIDDDCDGDVDEDELSMSRHGISTTMVMDLETRRVRISTAISPLGTSRIVRIRTAGMVPNTRC